MRFIRSLRQSLSTDIQRELSAKSIVGVTIGNFDGMHLGHQALFSTVQNRVKILAAAEAKTPLSALVTFIPHPRVYLGCASKRQWHEDPRFWTLNSLSTKIELAEVFGFDFFVRLKFNRHFASLTPQGFVKLFLVSALHARVVVVGEDWRFGEGRAGGVELLRSLGQDYGFEVISVPPVEQAKMRISTSRVKQAVSLGEFSLIKELLGRNFELAGKVCHGDKRGRALGFPTANIIPRKQLLPPDGVYASYVHIGGQRKPAVTYIGCRPTFDGSKRRVVESYLLGVEDCSLYGKRIRVEFISNIRADMKFAQVADLVAQMRADIARAEQMLSDYEARV